MPIDMALASRAKMRVLSQEEFENALVEMLVEDMQPLGTVEQTGFKKFCKRILPPELTLISRRTVGRRVDALYKDAKEKFIQELASVRWVSCMADMWSSHKRSYLGLTVHYICPRTLRMKSSVIACRRFRGSHTGRDIGIKLAAILKEFNISSKVQNITTDNVANFAKAFTLFSTTNDTEVESDDEDSPTALASGQGGTQGQDNISQGTLDIVNIEDLLQENEDSDQPVVLPPHKKCGNHSLNLVASVDALKARDDKTFKRNYDRAMGKVQALSNIVNRSTSANDKVEDITGTTFMKPVCTRWCSEYYAVE